MRGMAALCSCLVLLVIAFPGPNVSAQSPVLHAENALWVAGTHSLVKISTSDGGLLFEIPGLQNVRAVAVDDRLMTVWLFTDGALSTYGFGGEPGVSIPVSSATPASASLAVHPDDGSVWLGVGKDLWSFSPSGELLHSSRLAGNIEAFAMDGENDRLWIATMDQAAAWDTSTAAPLLTLDLGIKPSVQDVSAVPSTGEVWVALADGVRHFNTLGELLSTTTIKDVRRIAATADGAWAATTKDLLKIRAGGTIAFSMEPFHGGGNIVEIETDPGNGSVWLASSQDLAQVSDAGQVMRYLEFEPPLHVWDLALYADMVPPEVEILSPAEGSYLNTRRPPLELRLSDAGSGFDPEKLSVTANGAAAEADCEFREDGATCLFLEDLSEGATALAVTIEDHAGNRSGPERVAFTVDTIAPRIQLTTPPDGFLTNQPQIVLAGSISEAATLTINGQPVPVSLDGSFTTTAALQESPNAFSLVALDRAGNSAAVSLTVIRDSTPPAPVNPAGVTVSQPNEGQVTVSAGAGAAEPGSTLLLTNTRTGAVVSISVGADGSFSSSVGAQARDILSLVLSDAAGNQSQAVTVVVPDPPAGGGLPPDPAAVASAIDPAVATDLAAATEFLFTGAQPVQTGVAPGTIEPRRAAILRGKVSDREGSPLTGVEVTVKGHPELGTTRTREDGLFDLAVNGGDTVVVQYQKEGYLPVQRPVEAPWRDFTRVEDVVLVSLDAESTLITAGLPGIQVARGSLVSDQDGSRRATLLFPESTGARMVMPDGSRVSLSTLTVRATEYTVGSTGPAAMPGPLTPGVAYTYAVELSADEAIAAGAKSVEFTKPVLHYVENFLGFPIGGIVPVGYYDRDLGAWVASANGRVIKILSIADGLALLDVTGSGSPSDDAALQALGITETERRQLAELYPPGQSLWRVPIPHFTPWDCNWPYGPPPDAKPPEQPEPETDDPEDEPCEQPGSIIECQNQTLGESLPIAGTPYTLNYRSDRVPGRKGSHSIQIPLSGSTVPATLKRIELKISVAGQLVSASFPNAPNQRHLFTWDGKDAYGRTLYGRQPVTVEVGYVYDAVYQAPANFDRSFAQLSGVPITSSRTRQEITLWQKSRLLIGSWSIPPSDLGAWSLSPHHYYDEGGGNLFLGSGERVHAGLANQALTTVAGQWTSSTRGDGGPATAANLDFPHGIDLGPDGTLYIADPGDNSVRKVTPDGKIWTIANSRSPGFVHSAYDVAAGPDGSVYFSDHDAVKRIDRNGVVKIVYGYYDGAQVIYGIDVDENGNLYASDYGRAQVVKIDAGGRVTVVAGSGTRGFSGDGGPARQARLYYPYDVAVDRTGNIYVNDYWNGRIRRVSPDGIIRTVAGNGTCGFAGDGGPATLAALCNVRGIATGPDGSIYLADSTYGRIRRVAPNGFITTVAGSGIWGHKGDGGPATAAEFRQAKGVAVGPDGLVYVSDSQNGLIRKIGFALPGFSRQPVTVGSRDGRELFFFDDAGRHLKTVDTLTGHTVYEFSYDAAGRLASVRDANAEVTLIERNAAGRAVAVVSPYGARTELASDANGYLASVRDPAGGTVRLVHSSDGLLMSTTDPRNGRYEFQYDALGRLSRDQDPAGGFQSLARTSAAGGYRVDLTSDEGRTRSYSIGTLPTEDRQSILQSPSGARTTTLLKTDGTRQVTSADGTVVTAVMKPDPRFGMVAAFPESFQVRTPAGRTLTLNRTLTAVLDNPANPLSLRSLQETVVHNGRTFTNLFDATQRKYTFTTPAGRQRSVTVDAYGRPTLIRWGTLEPLALSYDSRGRLASLVQGSGAGQRMTTLGYGSSGWLANVTDPLARSVELDRGATGQIVGQRFSDGRLTVYSYDANGNLESIIPPGRPAHSFEHTPTDLEAEYTPPDAESTRFYYNGDRQVTRIERPDGRAIGVLYDGAGRLGSLDFSQGEIVYSYTSSTGKLSSITSPGGQVLRFTYDGFLTTAATWSGPIAGSVEYGYDNNFRVTRKTVNGANPITYQFDPDGLVIQAGPMVVQRDAGNGFVTGTTLGQVTTTQSYNSFGELAAFEARIGGVPALNIQYDRDAIGRITGKTETLGGSTSTYGYSYDPAGRLREVLKNGASLSRYEYDANGNQTARETAASGSVSATFDAQDRLLSHGTATYTYTENGELAGTTQNGSTVTYGYDELGNLRTLSLPDGVQVEYVIDGQNRRVGKRVNGVLVQGFLYESQLKPIAELDGAGQVVARFTYGIRPNVPDLMTKAGVTYRIVSDHLGSPRLVVDSATGTIVQRMDYDELGQVVLDTNPGFQPFGFVGGLYDQHSGFLRFGTRDYDPRVGRWTAKDPTRFAGLDANLYSYTSGDPVNFVDSTGLMKLPADPTGLPNNWTHDPSHRDPNGERFRHPNGDVLDFHKGRPGERGWKGRDHWHHRPGGEGGDEHLRPGDEIPDPVAPQEVCRLEEPASPVPYIVGAAIGAAIIVGTLAEDVFTGGVGVLDDPVTIGLGVSLILGTAAAAGPGSGG